MPSIQAAIAALNKKINSTFAFLAGSLLTIGIIFALLNNNLRNEIEQVKLGNVYAESIHYDKLADDVFTTVEYKLSDGTTAQGKVLKGTTSNGQPVGKFYIQLENGGVVEAEIKGYEGNTAFDITQYSDDIKNIVATQIATELNKLDLSPDQTIINQTITVDLGPDAVKTINIADSAVTNAKIASNAITLSKLADNSVTSDKLADGTITNDDISNTANIGWDKINKAGSSLADFDTRNASDINISDSSNYFSSTDVEGALQEVGSISSGIASNYLKLDATNGPITGNLQINADLGVSGTITGNLNGNVTGNVTGDVTGNVSGNAGTVTNGVYTTGSYNDPTWLTGISGTKVNGDISGNAANITGVVALSNGGTGTSLTAPAGDRILFYDQSAGNSAWLDIGSNLSISGTTINATDQYTGTVTNIATGNGLSGGPVTSIGTISINAPTCSGTDKLQWTGTAFICNTDIDTDTNTTYTNGNGLDLTGTIFSLGNLTSNWSQINAYDIILGNGTFDNSSANADLYVTGNLEADGIIYGNLTGNVTGNVTGDVTGNISGNAANVTGIVAILNGGTGASDATTARTNLGLISGGAGDIWVEKAGDTMTGDLTFSDAQKIIGGTSTTADLTFQTTSGVGATGADMHFLVGNNGATEAMTILNNGNVGIGTSSPGQPLNLFVNNSNSSLPFLLQQNGTGDIGLSFLVTNGGSQYWSIGVANATDTLRISPTGGLTGSSGVSINTAGRVGIGTTSPNYTLDILDSASTGFVTAAQFSSSNASTQGTQLIIGTNSNLYTKIGQNHGTNGPFTYGTYLDTYIANEYIAAAGAYGNIHFATNGAVGMTLTGGNNAGKVGIGITSPGAKLQINTGANTTIGQIIKANSISQSANLQEWRASDDTVKASVSAAGSIKATSSYIINRGAAGDADRTAIIMGLADTVQFGTSASAGEKTQIKGSLIDLWGGVAGSTEVKSITLGGGVALVDINPTGSASPPGAVYFQVRGSSTSTVLMNIYANGRDNINFGSQDTSFTHFVGIKNITASKTALKVVGAVSQTGNLQEWQNSSGTRLAAINAYGTLGIGGDGIINNSITTTSTYTSTTTDESRAGISSSVLFYANHNTTVDTNFGYRSTYTIRGTGTKASIYAFDSLLDSYDTGAITALIGYRSRVRKRGNHNVTSIYASSMSYASTAESTGGVVGAVYGNDISFSIAGAETYTSAYGLRISNVNFATTNFAIQTNSGNVVFNEGGDANTDFRVEGDTDANLLFTDASADKVGIGTNTPDVKLDVGGDIESTLATSSDGSGQVCYAAGGANGGTYLLTRCASSSERYKENIQDSTLGLAAVEELRPVTFDYKESYSEDGSAIGFIAEEVENISPLLVNHNSQGQVEGVKYEKLTALLTKAVQEQQDEITSLQAQLEAIKTAQGTGQQAVLSGAVRLDSLEVIGDSTFSGSVAVNSNVNINKNLGVNGDALFIGKSQFIGTTEFTGIVNILSELNVQSNAVIKGSLTSDSINSNKANIAGDADISGHLKFGADTSNTTKVIAGSDSVNITFNQPYQSIPYIIVSPQGDNYLAENVQYSIIDRTLNGFTIKLNKQVSTDIDFTWLAIE